MIKIILTSCVGSCVAQNRIVDPSDGKCYGFLIQDHGSIVMNVNGNFKSTKSDDFDYSSNKLKNKYIASEIFKTRNTLIMHTEGPSCSGIVLFTVLKEKLTDMKLLVINTVSVMLLKFDEDVQYDNISIVEIKKVPTIRFPEKASNMYFYVETKKDRTAINGPKSSFDISKNTNVIIFEEDDDKWGIENDEWCGIKTTSLLTFWSNSGVTVVHIVEPSKLISSTDENGY
ncbi:hypothetical protein H8356DRAFT_1418462 [Neocallimastix lanati (nom. inval.)]|nr:hypothetical protein H8356DRAFT_1418462 [Neocallimastix sp. JGI-2020a]